MQKDKFKPVLIIHLSHSTTISFTLLLRKKINKQKVLIIEEKTICVVCLAVTYCSHSISQYVGMLKIIFCGSLCV